MRTAAILLCAALFLLPAAGITTEPAQPAIRIISCAVASGNVLTTAHDIEAVLVIRFQNYSNVSYKRLTWRAKYGVSGWLDFVDDGTFSPGVEITQMLQLHHHAKGIWAGDRMLWQDYLSVMLPESCALRESIDQDSHEWVSSLVPMQPFSVPTEPPRGGVTLPSAWNGVSDNPVGINACKLTVTKGRHNFASIDVRMKNLSTKELSAFTVRAPYGSGTIDATYTGAIGAGQYVEKHIDATLPQAPPWDVQSLNEANECVAIRATYSDATTWNAPGVAQSPAPFPSPAPNADLMRVPLHAINAANWFEPPTSAP